MGSMEKIHKLLSAGKTPQELIADGYPKSTVYAVAKKVGGSQLPANEAGAFDDEVLELKQKKQILKLEKDIAELQAEKEKLPGRLAAAEKKVDSLRLLIEDAVDTALFICLQYAGVDKNEAKQFADGWVQKEIEKGLPKE
jgi:hypothetical protein